MRTLDSLITELDPKGKTLLKLDVQGYELEVLEGGRACLRTVDRVLVEVSLVPLYAGSPQAEEVISFLLASGFALERRMAELRHPATGEVLQADLLMTRTDAPLQAGGVTPP